MKYPSCILVILFLACFAACEKEEPNGTEGNGIVNSPVSKAYVKTMVIDSTTGLPVNNAVFRIHTPGYVDTMVVNNWYTGCVSWGGDPRMPWGRRPDDSTTITFDATLGALYGSASVKGWQLRVNDTLRLPDIYIAP
jgi:hypothetical protein